MLHKIKSKVLDKVRIDREEAKWLFSHASDDDLKDLATSVKSRFHPQGRVTYLKMAILNFTNICVAKCDYCAFYRLPHQSGGYTLTTEQILTKVKASQDIGCSMIGFNAGFNPKLKLSDYVQMFSVIRERFPKMQFYEMTVAEFMFYCKKDRLTYAQGAKLLADAGSQWVPGGGAEVLDDAFRMRHSPGKYKVADYFSAQEAIINAGMGSTATMVIGFDETLEERFNHLENLRLFQDRMNKALPSFLCWTFKPWNTEFGGEEISTEEYLRWLAVSRIFLDNIENIRTSVLTQNEFALHGLDFGANDFDLPTEDEVTEKAGANISHDYESVLAFARKMGHQTSYREPFVRRLNLSQNP